MKDEIEAKIEYRQIIAEVKPGSYKPVRFTRVKYKASPEAHIDIRQFQRGYDGDGEDTYYPTKTGFQFLEKEFRRVLNEYTMMPETYVHTWIAKKSFQLLNAGEYESAVLQAFKAIETRIRAMTGLSEDEYGLKLIRKVLHPKTGVLTDAILPMAEREAFCNYTAGAFGFYKNPCSHRDIELDAVTAYERIVVASDILKRIEQNFIMNHQEKLKRSSST